MAPAGGAAVLMHRARVRDPWTTADLRDLARLRRREGRSHRVLYGLLTVWNLTLAVSNVAHYLGGAGIGYGLALLVHAVTSVYAVAQLWRTRYGGS
jgi:hypothetical protein